MVLFEPAAGSHTHIAAAGRSLLFHAYEANDSKRFEIWSNISGDWHATQFERIAPNVQQARVALPDQTEARYEFTYRSYSESGDLHWLGGPNGSLTVNAAVSALPDSLGALWQDLPSELQPVMSSGNARTFSYALPEHVAAGQVASLSLGKPTCSKVLALQRSRPHWLEAQVYHDLTHLNSNLDIQLLLLKSSVNPSVLMAVLPLTSKACMTTVRGSLNPHEQPLWLVFERGVAASAEGLCVIGYGFEWDLHKLMEQMVAAGREALAKSQGLALSQPKLRSAPPLGLTFCTYNALGIDWKLSDLFGALSHLADSNAADAFDTVLFDDGWQDTSSEAQHTDGCLKSFGAKAGWMDVELTKADTMRPSRVSSKNVCC